MQASNAPIHPIRRASQAKKQRQLVLLPSIHKLRHTNIMVLIFDFFEFEIKGFILNENLQLPLLCAT